MATTSTTTDMDPRRLRAPRRAPDPRRRRWGVVGGLVLLALVPVAAGVFRVSTLATGQAGPEAARFVESPAPVVIHVVGAVIYALLGAFQFSPALRRGRRSWHARAGWLLVPSGLAVAFSGLWMTLLYDLPAVDGPQLGALGLMRLATGVYMAVAIVLGVRYQRRRRMREHGAWMIRAYAVAMAAGTQVFTSAPVLALGLETDQVARAVSMGAGWAINLLVAEWVIRRRLRAAR